MGRFHPFHCAFLGGIIFAMPSVAAAIDLEPYGSLYGGLSLLEDADAGLGSLEAEFDPGFVVGATYGARVVDAFTARLELDLSYRRHEIEDIGNVSGGGDVNTFGALGNFWLDFINTTSFTPYVGGGLGLAYIDLNDVELAGADLVDDEDLVFAWQLGAGVGWEVSSNVTIGLDYRWFATADPEFENTAGSDFDSEYSSHNFMASVRYGFW